VVQDKPFPFTLRSPFSGISIRLRNGGNHGVRPIPVASDLADDECAHRRQPDWEDPEVFEQAREKILHYGTSKGMSVDELMKLKDPDLILGLWTAAQVADARE